MEVLLEARNLKKYFQTRSGQLHAVDGVSFKLEKGKTLGVVGESGCGKSTLGRVLLHMLEPTSGQIFFKGEDITQVTPQKMKELRREMQMIFQDPFSSLNPRMSVSDTIREPLEVYKIGNSREERDRKVAELMEIVGLASRVANAFPHELDGGRRQRIGIARALALNPSFIVCDEPVSALDVSIQAQILNLMQDLQKERNLTYLFITHDLSVVKHISDDIMIMYLGTVVEKCPSKNLFQTQYHPYTQALLSAIPIPKTGPRKERIILRGEITSPINPAPGCRFAPRCIYHDAEKCAACSLELDELTSQHYSACPRSRELAGLTGTQA